MEQAVIWADEINGPVHRDEGFRFDGDCCLIEWGGYEYPIDLVEIDSPIILLDWIYHISGKEWPGTTADRIGWLIEMVCARKGWDLFGHTTLTPRATSNSDERAKLTPPLRWRVLKRDGFACRACGATAATGAVLHIDHVLAIAQGGRTKFENLQTLCVPCNLGKGRS